MLRKELFMLRHHFRFLRITGWGLVFAFLLGSLPCLAAEPLPPLPQESKEHKDARMQWWREARFGMFIHWGLYCITAGEWNGQPVNGISSWIMSEENGKIPVEEYRELVHQFNPVKFSAQEWVQIAKDAGVKYIILTSKHHEGFCLFDSKYTDYDVMSTPFQRDILKELSDECHKQGMRIGWYYSQLDWSFPEAQGKRSPDYGARLPELIELVNNHTREITGNYGRIDVLWFDGEWMDAWTESDGRRLYQRLRQDHPDLIINNRIGKGRQAKPGEHDTREYVGDFGTPEQEIPATGMPGYDWETCMTMNDSWGFKKNDHNWKPAEVLIRQLVDTASKGGNYLLNVGPTPEGIIPPPSVERLEAMGKWLKVNGESIYGTSAGIFPKLDWGRCTVRPGKLYLHVFDWPADGRLVVPGLKNEVKKTYLLADKNTKLKVSVEGNHVIVTLPEKALDPIDTVVVLNIKGQPEVNAPV